MEECSTQDDQIENEEILMAETTTREINESFIEIEKVENYEDEEIVEEIVSAEDIEVILQSENSPNKLKIQKMFKCSKCNQMFRRMESCKSHMRRHLNIMNYKCATCLKVFFLNLIIDLFVFMYTLIISVIFISSIVEEASSSSQ